MKGILVVAVTMLVLAAPAGIRAGENVQAPGRLGAGVTVGHPFEGLSCNWYLTRNTSLQLALELWLQRDWVGIGGSVDYLFWMPRLVRWTFADLNWFWGPGGVFSFFDSSPRGHDESFVGLGVELAAGSGLQFVELPFDLNVEVGPLLNLLGHDGLHTDVDVLVQINTRYYF